MCTNFRGFNFRWDACPQKLVPNKNLYVYGSKHGRCYPPWITIREFNGLENCVKEKVERLKLFGERIGHMHSHDALALLFHSLGTPNFHYILCIAPCFTSLRLDDFDVTLRSILCNISNIDLSEASWLWTAIPVTGGGLGKRSVVHLATLAFLASMNHPLIWSSTCSLLHFILPLFHGWSQLCHHSAKVMTHCFLLLLPHISVKGGTS